MHILSFSFIFFLLGSPTDALWCWKCDNAKSNEECQRLRRKELCLFNQASCFNEVRRGWDGTNIKKGCKQQTACANNNYQNLQHAFPTQCNARSPTSTCRCCCTFNGCNAEENCKKEYDCPPVLIPQNGRRRCNIVTSSYDIGTVCRFQCNIGFDMVGPKRSTCMRMDSEARPKFNNPAPRCVHKPCHNITAPHHGTMTCTSDFKFGSVCKFECENVIEIESDIPGEGLIEVPSIHDLIGQPTIQCLEFSRWSSLPPVCVAVNCKELFPVANVSMTCTYGTFEGSVCSFSCDQANRLLGPSSTRCSHVGIRESIWTNELPICIRKRCEDYPPAPNNGSFSCSDEDFLNSRCEFTCDRNHRLSGSHFTQCIEEEGVVGWNFNTPICERVFCEKQKLRNGEITCTDDTYADSVCTYECTTEHFELDPRSVTSAICMEDANWNVTKPCCARVCPPYSVVDVVIMIDSSSSIGQDNWNTIKTFVRNLINTFVIGPDAVQLGVFRYNRDVDTSSQILLRDYPNDKAGLLRAFDQIPYDGSGTFTGNALRHAQKVLLHPGNGNRVDVPDYIIIITDGLSRDSISEIASQLHRDQTHIFVIGVVPRSGELDFDQLNQLVTHKEDLVIAKSGFEDLNTDLFKELVEIVCTPGCL